MARALGSYPGCRWFKSDCRYFSDSYNKIVSRPVGQAVKTPPFHGGNAGSSPARVSGVMRGEPPQAISLLLSKVAGIFIFPLSIPDMLSTYSFSIPHFSFASLI